MGTTNHLKRKEVSHYLGVSNNLDENILYKTPPAFFPISNPQYQTTSAQISPRCFMMNLHHQMAC